MNQNLKVEVGHFEENGRHYSGYTYPELMQLHHYGTGNGPGDIPARPVLTYVGIEVDKNVKKVFKDLKTIFSKPYSQKQVRDFLQVSGEKIKEIEQDIIGSTPPLVSNSGMTISLKNGRDTPLEDSGDLKDKVEVKVK